MSNDIRPVQFYMKDLYSELKSNGKSAKEGSLTPAAAKSLVKVSDYSLSESDKDIDRVNSVKQMVENGSYTVNFKLLAQNLLTKGILHD